MQNSRRQFLRSSAAMAAAVAAVQAQSNTAAPSGPEPQVPKMKFGDVEISRLVLGCNPFYGNGHFNNTLAAVMRDFFTTEKVCEVMRQANRYGINAYNGVSGRRPQQDWERFQAGGGRMHQIFQGGNNNLQDVMRIFKPFAIYNMGEVVDRAFQNDTMDEIKDWCKRARDLGVRVGVGTHKPEVIAEVESQGWDVDFYAGCVYNRTRTRDEWKQVLNGQSVEMQGELYLQSDPPRMYKVMRQTKKPCFAFKIMAAGRIEAGGAEQAFRTAFESIKPNDGVFVGVFPRIKDEVKENAERVHRILAGA